MTTALASPFTFAADLLDPLFTEEERARGLEIWREVRRPSQCAPTDPIDWYLWLILAGRGWGKTRTGAEWLLDEMTAFPHYWYAMVGPTTDDIRDIMVEGESGLLACADARKIRYHWNKQLGHFKIVGGARADTFTAEKPDGVRGPNLRAAWGDEPASWRYGQEVWDTLQFAMRKGNVRVCMTGTPKSTPFIRMLIQAADVITKGHSDENRANLSEKFYSRVIKPYVGTRLGRQELAADILDDVEGALWTPATIDANRVQTVPSHQELDDGFYVDVADLIALLISMDPSVSNNEKRNVNSGKIQRASDEVGIVVAALGENDHGYMLGDFSGRMPSHKWAKRGLDLYDQYEADRLIAEVNNGGDLVESAIRAACKESGRPMPLYNKVRAGGKLGSKGSRAEPVAQLDIDGLIHHVGYFPLMEDEMTTWIPRAKGQKSPNRIDARVYAFSELMLRKQGRKLGYTIS
jgi:phage terminase large subunit-like protein